jgi:hypothetical protein
MLNGGDERLLACVQQILQGHMFKRSFTTFVPSRRQPLLKQDSCSSIRLDRMTLCREILTGSAPPTEPG